MAMIIHYGYVIMTNYSSEVVTMRKVLVMVIVLMLSGCACAETRARFLFIGDLMIHDQQLDAAKTKDGYDFSPSFRRIKR